MLQVGQVPHLFHSRECEARAPLSCGRRTQAMQEPRQLFGHAHQGDPHRDAFGRRELDVLSHGPNLRVSGAAGKLRSVRGRRIHVPGGDRRSMTARQARNCSFLEAIDLAGKFIAPVLQALPLATG